MCIIRFMERIRWEDDIQIFLFVHKHIGIIILCVQPHNTVVVFIFWCSLMNEHTRKLHHWSLNFDLNFLKWSVPTWRATGSTRQQPAPLEICCSRWYISASQWQSRTLLPESKMRKNILYKKVLYSNIKAFQNAVRFQNEYNVSKWDQIAD